MTELLSLSRRDRLVLFASTMALCLPLAVMTHNITPREAALLRSVTEMRQSGDWLQPTIANEPCFQLTPIEVWVIAGQQRFFPTFDSLIVLQLGSCLVLSIALVLTAELAATLRGRFAGFATAGILLTSSGVIDAVRHHSPAIWLMMIVSLVLKLHWNRERSSASGFLTAVHSGSRWKLDSIVSRSARRMIAAGLICGLGTLVAGFVPAVCLCLVPVLAGAFDEIREASRRRLSVMFGLLPFFGFLLTASIWPLALETRSPGAWQRIAAFEVNRILSSRSLLAVISELMPQLLPWGLLLPLAIRMTWHDALCHATSRERRLWQWGLLGPSVLLIIVPNDAGWCVASAGIWSVLSVIALRDLASAVVGHSRLRTALRAGLFVGGLAVAVCGLLLLHVEQRHAAATARLDGLRMQLRITGEAATESLTQVEFAYVLLPMSSAQDDLPPRVNYATMQFIDRREDVPRVADRGDAVP